jgi:protocatechuate 3,4-dioxygenase beta subunit
MSIFLILFAVTYYFVDTSPVTEAGTCRPTMNDVEGPYYLTGSPFRDKIAGPDEQGERIIVSGTVRKSDCQTPVRNALIEVWQTDAKGKYYYSEDEYRLRGQLKADEKGRYQFSTIKPGRYRIMSGFRPAHIHLKISHPDFKTVTTQLYFKGDPYLWPNDACGPGCKSNDPLRIISLQDRQGMRSGNFDVILDPVR